LTPFHPDCRIPYRGSGQSWLGTRGLATTDTTGCGIRVHFRVPSKKLAVSSNRAVTRTARTTTSPPGPAILSILVPSVVIPCREPLYRRGRLGFDAEVSPGQQPRVRPVEPPETIRRRPSRGPPDAATAVALSNTRYRNEADEGCSSLAFATARREVLSGFPYASSRTLHRADPAPFEVGIGTLLCFTSPIPTPPSPPPTGPCGPPSDASLGISKDRPSVVYS